MNASSENNTLSTETKITATQVPDGYRLGFLPRHFGRLVLVVEAAIYYRMGMLAPSYTGGFWAMTALHDHPLEAPRAAEAFLAKLVVHGGLYVRTVWQIAAWIL